MTARKESLPSAGLIKGDNVTSISHHEGRAGLRREPMLGRRPARGKQQAPWVQPVPKEKPLDLHPPIHSPFH